MSLKKIVFRNAIFNAIKYGADRIGAIIFTVIIARMLDPELFGIYSIALSTGLLFLTFADLGINNAMVRYVSEAFGKQNKDLASTYFKYLLKFKLALTLIISAVMIVFSKQLAEFLFNKPELFMPFIAVGVFLIFQSIFSSFDSLFYALQKVNSAAISRFLFEVVRIILAPILIILGFAVFGVLIGSAIAAGAAALFLLIIMMREHSHLINGAKVDFDKKKLLNYLYALTISSIAGVFFIYIDTLMLGVMLPAEFTGYYRAAYALVYAVIGIISLVDVTFPIFTQLDEEKLNTVFQKVFKYSAILSIPASIGVPFIAAPFIKIIYGVEYLPAVPALAALSLLIFASTSGALFTSMLNARERPYLPAKIIIVGLILNIILNYFFILRWGYVGAAYATIISNYLVVIITAIILRQQMKVSPKIMHIIKPIIATAVMAVVLIFLLPEPTRISIGGFNAIVAVGIYFVSLWIIKGFKISELTNLVN